jgi:hypothetical protein
MGENMTVQNLRMTIESMRQEFKRTYYLEEGGCGVSWKFCQEGRGDLIRAETKAALLRDVQNYREGLRDA